MNRFESITKPMMWSTTLLLAVIVAGCGGSGDGIPGAGSGSIGSTCSGTGCVNLGTAANYVILAKTGVSTTGVTAVTGNIGLSPAAGSFLTGWAETANGAPVTYSTSAQVTGKLYAANYTGGTTSVDLTTAVGDMQTAYTTANGGPAGATCPGANFGGLTITAGVYDCVVNVGIATSTTLSGPGVFVFRITGTLTQAAATQVNLINGAVAQNVFWVVSQGVDIGTTATMNGVILGKTLINLQTGAKVNGRLLAQAAVALDANTVRQP